jgi:hypothetical protein
MAVAPGNARQSPLLPFSLRPIALRLIEGVPVNPH